MKRMTTGQRIFTVFNVLILTSIALLTLYPMLYVLFASVSDGNLLLAHKGVLLKPLGFSMGAYKKIVQYPLIIRSYGNTLFIVTTTLILNVILTSFGAYFLSRKGNVAGRILMMCILFTMYFSGGLIPTYLNIKNLGLYNSMFAIILPASINTFNLIVLKTSFESIPYSLCESAEIDGASHFRILFSIILPLSKASLSVIVLYYAVQHWNSWFNAMIYLKDRNKYPLQLVLREILLQNDTSGMTVGVIDADRQSISESLKYAVIIFATVPILCIYPFLQKYFAKGTMIGAVKG